MIIVPVYKNNFELVSIQILDKIQTGETSADNNNFLLFALSLSVHFISANNLSANFGIFS